MSWRAAEQGGLCGRSKRRREAPRALAWSQAIIQATVYAARTSAGSLIIHSLHGASVFALRATPRQVRPMLRYTTRASAGLYVRRAVGSQLLKEDHFLGYLIIPTRFSYIRNAWV